MSARVSPKVHDELINLGKHPHVLKVAAQVHPTWISAHGHIKDMGVERLAVTAGEVFDTNIEFGVA